jgi:preprotein translocase SecE subunit
MAKVSWPTREELTGSTGLVIFISIVIAVVVKGFDVVLSQTLKLFLR